MKRGCFEAKRRREMKAVENIRRFRKGKGEVNLAKELTYTRHLTVT